MDAIATYLIIGITIITSYQAFENPNLMKRMLYNPYAVWHHKQYSRLFTSGLIHSGWLHLGVNMIVLYFFGRVVEQTFVADFGFILGEVLFVTLYILGLLLCHIPSFIKHRDNAFYNALGASGATSAILFTAIVLYPTMTLYLYFAIPMPAIVAGIGYLVYSQYMANKNLDNIGHDAHFAGAVVGILFPIMVRPQNFTEFIHQLSTWL